MSTVFFLLTLALAVVISASLIIVLIYNLRSQKESGKRHVDPDTAGELMGNQNREKGSLDIRRTKDAA